MAELGCAGWFGIRKQHRHVNPCHIPIFLCIYDKDYLQLKPFTKWQLPSLDWVQHTIARQPRLIVTHTPNDVNSMHPLLRNLQDSTRWYPPPLNQFQSVFQVFAPLNDLGGILCFAQRSKYFIWLSIAFSKNFRLVVILGFPNDCKKGIQKAIWLDQESHVLCDMPEKESVVLVLVVVAIA
jgi:hypothetical protein